jgi:hypothetical protein
MKNEEQKWYKYFRVKDNKLVSSYVDPENDVNGTMLTYGHEGTFMAPVGSPGIVVTDEPEIQWGNVFYGMSWYPLNRPTVKLYQVFPVGKVIKKNLYIRGKWQKVSRWVCPGIKMGKKITEEN